MPEATNDPHDIHADSYEEFCIYLYRLSLMICTIFMLSATNDLHDIHADNYEEFCMIFMQAATNDLHESHAECYE